MDILPTSEIEEKVLVFNDFEDAPINDYFDNFGYSSTNSIRNMGSSFIYIIVGIIFLLILLIINKLASLCRNKFTFI